jgi:hypothetical protein
VADTNEMLAGYACLKIHVKVIHSPGHHISATAALRGGAVNARSRVRSWSARAARSAEA